MNEAMIDKLEKLLREMLEALIAVHSSAAYKSVGAFEAVAHLTSKAAKALDEFVTERESKRVADAMTEET